MTMAPSPGGGALAGPWLPTPIDLDPQLAIAIGEGCRSVRDLPAEMEIVIVDARGGGTADAFLATADGALETCIGLPVDGTGVVGDILTGSSYEAGHVRAVGTREVDVIDGPHIEEPRDEIHLVGVVGSEIAEVRLTADGRPPIIATLTNGWFAAWLPGPDYARLTLRGYDADGVEVFASLDF